LNALRSHLFPALFTKTKSFVGWLITFLEDGDEEASPLREEFPGFFEDFGVALDVFGGDEGLGG
jgi:hypothetical protein